MSELAVHPAAELPEPERLEYFRLVASIALCDGRSDEAEIVKLRRLADALRLHKAVTEPIFTSLEENHLDMQVSPREALWFKEPREVRWHLMIDSIAIAFTDGRLSDGEKRRLTDLARQLEIDPQDVTRMAERIESILFLRHADYAVLTKELGAAVGGEQFGKHVIGRVRHLSGRFTAPE